MRRNSIPLLRVWILGGLTVVLVAAVGCQERVVRRSWDVPYGQSSEARDEDAAESRNLPFMQPPRRGGEERDESGDGFFDSIGDFLFGEPTGEAQKHPAVQSLPNEVNAPLPTEESDWPGNRRRSRSAD